MNEEKKAYLSKYLIQQAKINRINEMILICPDLRDDYINQIEKAKVLRNEIEQKIKNVDDGILSELLFQKYICGKSLMKVSFSINYSKRHTERLHIKALEKFKI